MVESGMDPSPHTPDTGQLLLPDPRSGYTSPASRYEDCGLLAPPKPSTGGFLQCLDHDEGAASPGQRTRQPSFAISAHTTAPSSPAFHAHRPATLWVGTEEVPPAAGPRSCSRPSSAPPPASVDPELTHVRTLDKLVARLHSPSRRQRAQGPTVLRCSSPQHSPTTQRRFSSGNRLASSVSAEVHGLLGQGRAGGARYPVNRTEAGQLQGDQRRRASSWLDKSHNANLLQAPTRQTTSVSLNQQPHGLQEQPSSSLLTQLQQQQDALLTKLQAEPDLYPSVALEGKAEPLPDDSPRCAADAGELELLRQQLLAAEIRAADATAAAEAAIENRERQHAIAGASAVEEAASLRQQLEAAEAKAAAAAAADAAELASLRQQLQSAQARAAVAAANAEQIHLLQHRLQVSEARGTAVTSAVHEASCLREQLWAMEAKAAAAATAEAEAAARDRQLQHAVTEQMAGLRQQLHTKCAGAKVQAKALVSLTQQLQSLEANAEATAAAATEAVRDRDQQHAAAASTAAQQVETLCRQLQAAKASAAAAAAEAEQAIEAEREQQHAAAETSLAEQVARLTRLRERLQDSAKAHAQVLDSASGQVQAMEAAAEAAAAAAADAIRDRDRQHAAAEARLAELVASLQDQLQAVESRAAVAEHDLEQREQQHATELASAAEQVASLRQQSQSSAVAHAQAAVSLMQQLQQVKATSKAAAAAAAEAIRDRDRQHAAAASTAAQQVDTLRQQLQAAEASAAAAAAEAQQAMAEREQQRATAEGLADQVGHLRVQLQAVESRAAVAERDLEQQGQQHATEVASAVDQVASLGQQLRSSAVAHAQAVVSLTQQLQEIKARAEGTAAAAAKAIRDRGQQHATAASTAAHQVETLSLQLCAAESRAAAAEQASRAEREQQHAAAEATHAEQVARLREQLQAVESRAAAAASEAEQGMEQQERQHAAAATTAADQVASLRERLQSSAAAQAQAVVSLTQQLQGIKAKAKAKAEGTAAAAAEAIRDRDQQHTTAASTAVQVETLHQQLQAAEARAAAATAEAEQAMVEQEQQHAAAEARLADQVAHLRKQLQDNARAHAQVLDSAREQLQACAAGAAAAANLVHECQSAWQQATSSKAALQDVHSALCAAITDSRSVILPADTELPQGNLESLSLQQLVAASAQDSKSAKQSVLSLHTQLQEAHAVLATCLNSLSSNAAAQQAGSGDAAAGDSHGLQLQQLAVALVQRCKSAEQQAADSQARLHEAHSILHGAQHQCAGMAQAAAAAPAEQVSEDDMPLQQLAAGLVDGCLAYQQGADTWRQQVQEDLAELQAAWAKVGRPAALRGKCPSGKCKEFWELQKVRALLVEAQLQQACAEQKAAACAQELEHTQQDMAAVRLQLAEAAHAPAAAAGPSVWRPEHAAAAAAGVLGVMALVQLTPAAGTATASGLQARSPAGLELAFTQSVRRRLVRVPACESPAAMLRLLRDTSAQHKQGAGQAPVGQSVLIQAEAAAAGAVALREASLSAAEYALWRSVTLAADAGARAKQQFEAGPEGAVSAEGLRDCIADLQHCQQELVVAAGELMLQDFLLALSRQNLHVCQTGWLQLPMPSSEVVQKLLAEAAPVSDACFEAAEQLQATLSSLDAQDETDAPHG